LTEISVSFQSIETFWESPSSVLVSFKAIRIDIVMESGEELQQILLSTEFLIIYKYSQAGSPVPMLHTNVYVLIEYTILVVIFIAQNDQRFLIWPK